MTVTHSDDTRNTLADLVTALLDAGADYVDLIDFAKLLPETITGPRTSRKFRQLTDRQEPCRG